MSDLSLITEEVRLELQGEGATLSLAAEEVRLELASAGVQGPPGPAGSGGNQNAPAIVAATALSALRVASLNDSDQLVYADASTVAHAFRLVGLLQSAVEVGSTATPLVRGIFSDSSWSWQLDKPIWLGANGFLSQVPSGTAFLVQVATPLTPTQIHFEFQEVTLL